MINNCNIIICGLGGQGIITLNDILAEGLVELGYNVKCSEIHGMGQRGGSVYTQLRFSRKEIFSPLIEKGTADFIIALEKSECLRYISYLNRDGKIIFDDSKKRKEFNNLDIDSKISYYIKNKSNILSINTEEICNENNFEVKIKGMILLGCLFRVLNFNYDKWINKINLIVKHELREKNLKALIYGFNMVKNEYLFND